MQSLYQRLISLPSLILLLVCCVGVYEYKCSCHNVARSNGELTYRERVLLVDPVNTSQVTKQYVAPLIHKFTLFDHGV